MLHPVLPAHQAYSVLADIERKIRNDVDQSPPGKSSEEARRKSARDREKWRNCGGTPVVSIPMPTEDVRVAKIAMAIAVKRVVYPCDLAKRALQPKAPTSRFQ